MNILITGNFSENIIDLLKKSKYTEKIYTAKDGGIEGFPNISYANFDELIQKAIDLKIDIAINTDVNLIGQGIAEVFEQSRINLISVNKKWLNLETSRLSAKKLLDYYKINNPKILKIPSDFPVVIKTDSTKEDFTVFSMDELLKTMESLRNKTIFLEEFTEGETFKLLAVWDRKNIKYFYAETPLTEVQEDRLDLLKTKLNFMFSDEKADFTGFLTINIIWYRNDWYVKDFETGTVPENIDMDLVYVLNSAIYQKLGEG